MPSRMGMAGAMMANAFYKRPFRLRVTHTFKHLHSPTSVSSTRNARFRKTALSNERLVYVKCAFPKSSVVSSTRAATFFENMASRPHQTTSLQDILHPPRTLHDPSETGCEGLGKLTQNCATVSQNACLRPRSRIPRRTPRNSTRAPGRTPWGRGGDGAG